MTPVVLLYYSVGSVVIHGVATEAGFPFYMTIALFSIKKTLFVVPHNQLHNMPFTFGV